LLDVGVCCAALADPTAVATPDMQCTDYASSAPITWLETRSTLQIKFFTGANGALTAFLASCIGLTDRLPNLL